MALFPEGGGGIRRVPLDSHDSKINSGFLRVMCNKVHDKKLTVNILLMEDILHHLGCIKP